MGSRQEKEERREKTDPRDVKEQRICRSYNGRIWSLFLTYAKCIICSIPRANSAITSDSHYASELSGLRFRLPKVLCRLAYKLLRFPKGYGSSERKGYIHFSEDNCKLPLPLGLPVASPSESFA